MGILTNIESYLHPEAPAMASPAPPAAIPRLADGIRAAAPHADVDLWVAALTPALTASGITTPRRIAALLGQCSVEAGNAFEHLSEDLFYTHADRVLAIFPREVGTLSKAATLVCNPVALGDCVYANRLGNGNEASGDGGAMCGHGLIQLTGRAAYTAFGATVGMTPEAAATYAATPAGAAASACWFWSTRRLNAPAEAWSITLITGAVNGPARLGLAARIAASNAALHAMGG